MTADVDVAFPGAQPFERTDNGRFFGRTAEAAYVGQLWAQHNVTYLTGPSAIGKTSLLMAGVLPLVEANNVILLPVGSLREGATLPVAALPTHNPYTLALLRSWSPGDFSTRLAGLTVDDFIGGYAEARDESVAVLAAIDHADDLLAGPDSRQRHRRRFLNQLAEALREQPTLHLLVSLREDALPAFSEIMGEGTQCRLGPLGIDEARQAAAGPGFFAAEAADDLVTSVRTSHIVTAMGEGRLVVTDQVEPALLQIACARLWESLRTRFGLVTKRDLRRHGDIDASLAGYCSEVIAAVAHVHEIPVAWLRFWLIRNFVTEVAGMSFAPEGASDTAGMARTVARALEHQYLLRGRTESFPVMGSSPVGSRVYELISHRMIEPLRHASDETAPPGNPDEYMRAAGQAHNSGELELAGKYAAEARKIAPDDALRLHAEACSLLGNLAYEQGDLVTAEQQYRIAAEFFEVIGNQRAVARLLAAVGRTLMDQGRLLEAINELKGAVGRAPDSTVQIELNWAVQELGRRLSDGPPFHISLG
jgi:hypothetical protein